ncbi:MAG: N-6 DNA methylase, partial [Clostridiales bacterium]|nr:N-6 DNA methylase [Clostridiales bacterium]
AFEYLLSIMGSQGDAGQFRTPRHIIDMIVEIVDPQKTDSVLDPACGTAGFLISSYKHILEKNKDADGNSTLSADDRKRMTDNFAGYDISPDMVRLSRVNMYLHKFIKPKIYEYDTLTSLERWDETYDVILANPPFMTPKGGIIPHNRYRVPAKRSEVLFVDYIAEHLNPTGKAGIIVPEGIVFQSAGAYKSLRKFLVDDGLLFAVISLPSGVFNPYSGVKTCILLFDRKIAKQKDEILFVKINNDGYGLGAQRREITGSDIPDVIKILKDYKEGHDVSDCDLATIASKEDISEQDYILVGERYKGSVTADSNYPMFEIGDICETTSGGTPKSNIKEYYENGDINWLKSGDIANRIIFDVDSKITTLGLNNSSAKMLPKNTVLVAMYGATVGQVGLLKVESTTNQAICGILPNDKVIPEYLYSILKAKRDYLISLSVGGAQPNISQSIIKQVKIPLPPLHIQEKIVNEIEGFQKIIDGARQVVDNYKPTFKVEPSWEIVRLGDVCEYDRQMINNDDNQLPYIGMEDIESNTGIISKGVYNKTNNIGNAGAYLFNENHILYGRLRPYLNKVATPAFSGRCSTELIPILVSDRINKDFLSIMLRSEDSVNFAMGTNTGARMPRTDMNAFKNFPIPLPTAELQQKIMMQINEEIAIVEQNKRLIEIFDQKIKDKISEVWGD